MFKIILAFGIIYSCQLSGQPTADLSVKDFSFKDDFICMIKFNPEIDFNRVGMITINTKQSKICFDTPYGGKFVNIESTDIDNKVIESFKEAVNELCSFCF